VVVSFIGGGNPEYLEKITDLPQVTDKPNYHIMFIEYIPLEWDSNSQF
jgi:hypothetical protein